jgi:hypothetical protein
MIDCAEGLGCISVPTIYTNGFNREESLIDHFTRHGGMLGVSTKEEYLERADEFCGRPRDPSETHIHECIRPREGDRIRYNELTEEWGVLCSYNVVRTYYILTTAIQKHGSGLAYFQSECAKT